MIIHLNFNCCKGFFVLLHNIVATLFYCEPSEKKNVDNGTAVKQILTGWTVPLSVEQVDILSAATWKRGDSTHLYLTKYGNDNDNPSAVLRFLILGLSLGPPDHTVSMALLLHWSKHCLVDGSCSGNSILSWMCLCFWHLVTTCISISLHHHVVWILTDRYLPSNCSFRNDLILMTLNYYFIII